MGVKEDRQPTSGRTVVITQCRDRKNEGQKFTKGTAGVGCEGIRDSFTQRVGTSGSLNCGSTERWHSRQAETGGCGMHPGD